MEQIKFSFEDLQVWQKAVEFNKNNWLDDEQLRQMKNLSDEIGKMLSGLISSIKGSESMSYEPRAMS